MTASRFDKVLVVGGSAAGISAADALRAEGFEGEVTVIGAEQHTAYARPALSKGILQGKETADSIALPALSSDIEVLTGVRAVALDLQSRTVTVERHAERSMLNFDAIVLATGCRARSLARNSQRGEHVIRDVEDSLALAAAFAAGQSAVILGGGLLGLELASSARTMGLDVTVVAAGPPLLRQLGPYLADLLTTAAREAGVRFELSPGGACLHGADVVTGAQLADGQVIEADVVITAIGDIPNVEWLAGSAISCEGPLGIGPGGFVYPGVVAAGDMTIARGLPASVPARAPHWHNAISQGRAAAKTLLNGVPDGVQGGAAYFWTEGFGLEIKIAGEIPVGVTPIILQGSAAEQSLVLQWSIGGRPVAAATVNHRMPLSKLKRLAAATPPLSEVNR